MRTSIEPRWFLLLLPGALIPTILGCAHPADSPFESTTGACCLGDQCQVVDPGTCERERGTYQGEGTICDPGACHVSRHLLGGVDNDRCPFEVYGNWPVHSLALGTCIIGNTVAVASDSSSCNWVADAGRAVYFQFDLSVLPDPDSVVVRVEERGISSWSEIDVQLNDLDYPNLRMPETWETSTWPIPRDVLRPDSVNVVWIVGAIHGPGAEFRSFEVEAWKR